MDRPYGPEGSYWTHPIGCEGSKGSKGSEDSEGSEGVVAADAASFIKRGVAGSAGCVEGLWKKVLKMDGPSAQGFLSLTGPLAPRVVVAADAVGCEEGFPTFIVPPLAGGRWCRRHQRGTGPLAPKVLKVLKFDRPSAGRFSGLTGLSGSRVVGRLRRRFYKPPSADPFRLATPLPTP